MQLHKFCLDLSFSPFFIRCQLAFIFLPNIIMIILVLWIYQHHGRGGRRLIVVAAWTIINNIKQASIFEILKQMWQQHSE